MTHPRSQLSAHSAPSLYGHAREHDACGIGFVVNIGGQRSQGNAAFYTTSHVGHHTASPRCRFSSSGSGESSFFSVVFAALVPSLAAFSG